MARKVSLARRMTPVLETLTGESVRVRPISRSYVTPTVATEEHWLPLSNLDRVVNPTFSSVILFYTNLVNAPEEFKNFTSCLKDSLAKTLVHFYPLAGRLAPNQDGQVGILCNDAGAVFIEATVEVELSAVGGPKPMFSIAGMEFAGLGAGPLYVPDQITSMPTLVIQVTKFKCGSVAVAANGHQTVADGWSGCHFMKSWAEIGAGRTPSILPNHDRLLLKARDTIVRNRGRELYTKIDKDKVFEERTSVEQSQPSALSSFNIGKTAVQGLKQIVNLEGDEGRQFTSAEIVSAHLWREMTKARAESTAPSERDSISRFFIFVDGRKQLNLPLGYFGNVVCSACATATEEEVLSKPIAHIANLVRKATRSLTGEYFRSLIDWVDGQGDAPVKSEHVTFALGNDVSATFWTCFPLYEMDFGWGKPDFAARNSPPDELIDDMAVMPSPEGPRNMVALLNLNANRMDRLEDQHSFNVLCAS